MILAVAAAYGAAASGITGAAMLIDKNRTEKLVCLGLLAAAAVLGRVTAGLI